MKVTLEQAKKLFKVDYTKEAKKRYKEAKREYRRLAKEYHPDAGGTKEDFQVVQHAWEMVEQIINIKPKVEKPKAHKPQRKKNRNIHTLFREVCEYIRDREDKHISLMVMSKEMLFNTREYVQVQEWIRCFQNMRYIIGTKVNFMPPGLTIIGLDEALDHVNQGNYGSSYYGSPLPMSVYKALARKIRVTKPNGKVFDFDLEDWED